MDQSIRLAQEKGYIETIFKRKRYLPDINSRNAVSVGMQNETQSMLLYKEVLLILSKWQ